MSRRLLTACWLALAFPALKAGELANHPLADRYEQLLAQHPDSTTALDRLWKIYQDADASAQLLTGYAAKQNTFSGALVYGYLLQRADRAPEAKTSFAKAAALEPRSPLPHLALAGLLEAPAEAAAEWDRAAQLQPKLETLLALGNAWQSAQQPEKAAAAWERAASLDPENLTLHAQLAANYEQNHLPERALAQYQVLAARGEPSARVQAGQSAARILQGLNRPEEAERALEQALALLPPGNWQRAPVQSQLVRLVQRAGRVAALEKRWSDEVTRTPNDLGGYWKLADFYQELGDPAKERVWLEKIAALAPDASDVAERLARAQRATGDARAAAKTLDFLLRTHEEESSLVFDRADLDLQLDQPGAAVARLEQLWRSHSGDEALQRRVLEFYRRARLQQPWERHLRENAAKGPDETVALARYLFTEHRREEARAALQKLIRPEDDHAAQATAWTRVAGELKEQNELAAAVQALREAVKLQPADAARRAALADALVANEQPEEAREQMLAGWRLDPSEANDQKLFQILLPRSHSTATTLGATTSLDDAPADSNLSARGQRAFDRYLAAILSEAVKAPTVDKLLRASRWLHWSQHSPEALALARRALPLAPDPIPIRKQILRIAQSLGNRQLAQEQLLALMKLDPPNARDWQRQLGQSQMDGGQLDVALTTFSELVSSASNDPVAWTDLALAQQQADRWSDALATWQRAFALNPASRRRDLTQPLLRALEHLGLFQKGADLLLSMADGYSDPTVRDPALADALIYSQQHGLTPWLETQLENRRRRDPSDVPILRSLAQLKEASGDLEAALQLLRQAAEQAPGDATLLRDIVHAAAEMGRPDEAIAQQRRLVQMGSQSDPAEWEALARNEESAGEIASASATWQRIAKQMPRDTDALQKCAAFFERWQEPEAARQSLRRVRVLAPDDLDALLALARQASPEEAMSCYEQVLQRSKVTAESAPLTYPGVITADWRYWQAAYFRALQIRGGRADGPLAQQFQELWRDGGTKPKGDAAKRLAAIEAISQLLLKRGDSVSIRDWLRRWDSVPAGSEALYAHYFVGDRPGTQQVLEALSAARPDDAQLRQAFVYLSLKMGNYAELARWMAAAERDPGAADLFLVGMARYAASAPRDLHWLEALFPAERKQTFLTWNVAAFLADEGRLDAAIWLGKRVYETAPTQRSANGWALAKWLVSTREIEEGTAVLEGSVEAAGSTLDDPIYDLLRRCVLLLPWEKREQFQRAYLERWRSSPLHAANARLLFAALGGSATELATAVAGILPMAPTPFREADELQTPAELRYWSYLANCGAQLQGWHLDRAANELWRQSLANPAEVALRSGQVPEAVRELRLRALAARIIAAPAGERARLINDFAVSAPANGPDTLAVMLESAGCIAPAQAAYRLAWQREPGNRQALQGLVNTSRAMGDLETARDVLLAALASIPATTANPDLLRELFVGAATTLRQNNQRVEARTLMDQSLARLPGDQALLERSARFLADDGEDEEAEKTYRTLLRIWKDSVPGRQGLQMILRREGRDEEAAALEPHVTAASSGASAGEPGARAEAAIALAKNLAAQSKNEEAQWRLWSALAEEMRPEFRFDLGWALLDLLPPSDARTPLLLGQMHGIISQAPAGAEGYRARRNSVDPWEDRARRYYDRIAKSGREGLNSVQVDWSAGAGNLQAGLALVRYFIAAYDTEMLAVVGRELIARAAELSERQLEETTGALSQTGVANPALALREGSRLSILPSFSQIQHEETRGNHREAVHLLDQLAARCCFDESLLAPVARQYDELREPAKARAYWEMEIAGDPAARKSESWLEYAAFLARQSDPAASGVFRRVYANPVTMDFRGLYDQLTPSGTFSKPEDLIADLALSPAQESAFWRGLLLRWLEQQNFPGVIDSALAHRDLVLGDRAALDAVRQAVVKTGRFAEVLAWLDPATTERQADYPWLPVVTAGIYADWANADQSQAIAHTERAVEISARDFALIKVLCGRYVALGDKEKARQVLLRFTAITRNRKEKAVAEIQLMAL